MDKFNGRNTTIMKSYWNGNQLRGAMSKMGTYHFIIKLYPFSTHRVNGYGNDPMEVTAEFGTGLDNK